MMLNLRALKEFPARLTLEDDAAGLDIEIKGVIVSGKARAELNVLQSSNVYYCTGLAVCSADLECSRCIEPYRVTLQGQVEFSIQEVADVRNVRQDEFPDSELVVGQNAGQVDITGPVREAIVLELPLKPLCRETCRGLCPLCGTNLNEHQCGCKVETTDPRWNGLRDLLK